MEIKFFNSCRSMSESACDLIVDFVRKKPDALLCAATGDTPTQTYQLLVEEHSRSKGLFAKIRLVKLDEWCGVRPNQDGSCEDYLQKHLLKPLGITGHRYYSFKSDSSEPVKECERMAEILRKIGPIDVAVLGVGVNGHIGFNEPGDVLTPFCHVAQLAPSSQGHSMTRHFGFLPQLGMTLGMADIMSATFILLLIAGQSKTDVFKTLLSRKISSQCPASVLWLHPHTVCLCDNSSVQLE